MACGLKHQEHCCFALASTGWVLEHNEEWMKIIFDAFVITHPKRRDNVHRSANCATTLESHTPPPAYQDAAGTFGKCTTSQDKFPPTASTDPPSNSSARNFYQDLASNNDDDGSFHIDFDVHPFLHLVHKLWLSIFPTIMLHDYTHYWGVLSQQTEFKDATTHPPLQTSTHSSYHDFMVWKEVLSIFHIKCMNCHFNFFNPTWPPTPMQILQPTDQIQGWHHLPSLDNINMKQPSVFSGKKRSASHFNIEYYK